MTAIRHARRGAAHVAALPSRVVGAVAIGAAAFLGLAAPALADCTQIDTEIRQAFQERAVDRFPDLHGRMIAEVTCDGGYRANVGRRMARLVAIAAGPEPTLADYEAALRYGRPWQVLVPVGDRYYEQEDWAKALYHYEEALDDMRDVAANPRPPEADLEERVYKRAVQARALAPTYIATRKWRGRQSGLSSPKFRNFTAVSVPVPVQFEYNSADLTEDGARAVEDIHAFLKQEAAPGVRIVGHTDPRGSDEYNQALSVARAQSVAEALRELGYDGEIEAVGRGESEPFQPDDASKYDEEERFAFDRRVEYVTIGN